MSETDHGGRYPVYILVDTSYFMARHVDELKRGLAKMLDSLCRNPAVCDSVAICVVEFNSTVNALIPLSRPWDIDEDFFDKISCEQAFSSIGPALEAVVEMTKRDLHYEHRNGFLPDRRPILVVLTNGTYTDEFGDVNSRAMAQLTFGIRALKTVPWRGVLVCGTGDFDPSKLRAITPAVVDSSNIWEVVRIAILGDQAANGSFPPPDLLEIIGEGKPSYDAYIRLEKKNCMPVTPCASNDNCTTDGAIRMKNGVSNKKQRVKMSEMPGNGTAKDGGRVPVYILLDTSGSMAENVDALKTGLKNILAPLQYGPIAEQVAICVAEYNSDVRVLIPLARPRHMEGGNIEITASGVTLTGNALKKVNEMSRQDLHFKTENDYRADKKPMLIILTDGAATDEYGQTGERAKQLLKEGIDSLGKWWGGIMACGMGNYNRQELIQITGSESNVCDVQDAREFFKLAKEVACSMRKDYQVKIGDRSYDAAIRSAVEKVEKEKNLDFDFF